MSEIKESVVDDVRCKGQKQCSPADFPDFGKYFNQYMMKEIGKNEFAKKLKVSRSTLDKLLEDFTK